MPTTLLDGESYPQAYARRFSEEAQIDAKMAEIERLREALKTLGTNLENYAHHMDNQDNVAMIQYYAHQAFNAL